MAGRSRWIVVIAVAVLVAAPAAAHATLVFVRDPVLRPTVWTAADDGSGQRRIANGSYPRISPDGKAIAYLRLSEGRLLGSDLMVVPVDGSTPPRRLATGWREPSLFDWSPDSATIAAVRGPEVGRKRLVLIDLASGAQRTIAEGHFGGVSFAPEGARLVYARATREKFPLRGDIFSLDLSSGARERLTDDHRSLEPLWGPAGKIVFVRLLGAKKRRFGPKNELYLMGPDGDGVRRLTRTRVDPLLQGLTPTQWSADGKRLLAEFVGQDTSYAVTVNPRTGAQRPLTKALEQGLIGTALSGDGRAVLGATGGFEPGPGHNVVSVPYGGGRPKVLARNAFEPDWSR